MDIQTLQKESKRIATEHGFYEDEDNFISKANIDICARRLMLIVTEAAEAMEDIRNSNWGFSLGDTITGYHPNGLGIELADIMIRVADFAEWQDIDLTEMIIAKMAYNEKRPWKHNKAV